MKIKTVIVVFLVAALAAGTAFAEIRAWTLGNGKTIEGELLSVIGGKVSLKVKRGKVLKIPEADFSDEDRSYIELSRPPKLDLSFSKKSKVRVFPDSLSDLPRSAYYEFKAVIKQTSTKPYTHELTAELFVIGREKIGDKHILLDYQKDTFRMEQGSGSIFELPSNTVELMQFEMNGQLMGEEYAGYMILVTDSRGELIAHVTKRDEWVDIADELRKLPVKKYFNKEGKRSFATRPKRWY